MTPGQCFQGSHNVPLNELFGNVVKGLWSIAVFMNAECKAAYPLFCFVQKC